MEDYMKQKEIEEKDEKICVLTRALANAEEKIIRYEKIINILLPIEFDEQKKYIFNERQKAAYELSLECED